MMDTDAAHMGAVLAYIAKLCAVEVLRELRAYLEKIRRETLPKSEAGQAVAYALNNWRALTRCVGNGSQGEVVHRNLSQ
jgi:hypothetical protein